MSNPETPLKKRPAAKVPKKKVQKQVVHLKVIDFTIWKGFKFGFGFMLGVAAFSLLATLFGFGLNMFFLGLFTSMGSPV